MAIFFKTALSWKHARVISTTSYTKLLYRKTGVQTGEYILIHFFAGCTHNLFLSQKNNLKKNYHNFYVQIVIFTVVNIQD